MALSALFEKYKSLPPAKRRLVLITPVAALMLYAFMTAPHGTVRTHDSVTLAANASTDCAATKLRMSIFGRSLVAYEWQSGVCPDTNQSHR
jgi:hypothetical protein